jgi:hypothetical protein
MSRLWPRLLAAVSDAVPVLVGDDVRARLAMRVRPRTPIGGAGGATGGQAIKVAGRLSTLGPPMIAPLSGRPCAYYHATVTVQVNESWITAVQLEEGCDFLLDDGSGQAMVAPRAARLLLMDDGRGWDGSASPAVDVMLAALAALAAGGRHQARGVAGGVRHREVALCVGDEVAVLAVSDAAGPGSGAPADPAAGAPYRSARRPLRLRAPATAALVISDDPSLCR